MLTRSGIPLVLLSASGIERQFVIDTGSCITLIDRELRTKLQDRGAALAAGRCRYRTLLGDVDAAKYRLANLSAADIEHEDLLAIEGSSNLIGRDYLSRYCVTLDFPHWRMYLKEGSGHARIDNRGLSGLMLRSNKGRIVVDAVERNSAAWEANIKAGDEIIRIDSEEPRTMSLFEIRRLLNSEEGREIPLEVSRSGETVCIVLTLRPTPLTDAHASGR
jgi:predicted metalloprotease with PDZ domain